MVVVLVVLAALAQVVQVVAALGQAAPVPPCAKLRGCDGVSVRAVVPQHRAGAAGADAAAAWRAVPSPPRSPCAPGFHIFSLTAKSIPGGPALQRAVVVCVAAGAGAAAGGCFDAW